MFLSRIAAISARACTCVDFLDEDAQALLEALEFSCLARRARHSPNLNSNATALRPGSATSNTSAVVAPGARPSASVRNDAEFAQAFPIVEITLSDLDETRIAMRRFRPRDYVSDARTLAEGLAPGATTALVFEVADPGRNAVAFEFKFGE